MTTDTMMAPTAPQSSMPAVRRSWSRLVALDVVAFLDVMAVMAGAILPVVIYSEHGGVTVDMFKIAQLALLVSLFAHLVLRHFGLYDKTRLHDLPVPPLKITAALAVAFLAVLGIGMPFLPGSGHFWMWYGLWAVTSLCWVLGLRLMSRSILRDLSAAGVFETRVAVYGSGRIAEKLETHLRQAANGMRLVGIYDDRAGRDRKETTPGPHPTGRLDDLIELGRSGAIDQIIISLPPAADQRTADIARRLSQLPVSLHVCTHIAGDLVDEGPAHAVSHVGPIGLLDVKIKSLSGWGRHFKTIKTT